MFFYVNKFFDGVNILLATIAGLALGFLLIAICISTLSRFFFNRPFSSLVEYSSYSLIYITFLAGPWLLAQRKHIAVDLITNDMNPRLKKTMAVIIDIMGVVITGVIAYFSLSVTMSNFQNDIRIMDSMRTPQWCLLAAVPTGCFFMLFQFMRNLFQEVSADFSGAKDGEI